MSKMSIRQSKSEKNKAGIRRREVCPHCQEVISYPASKEVALSVTTQFKQSNMRH